MIFWDSNEYLQFKTERTQPAIDLVKRIPRTSPAQIIDIGCGPGNSTAVVKAHFPYADIIGIDSSEDMIQKAKSEHADLTFDRADAREFLKTTECLYDMVFSNACLQWIPDHKNLLPELMAIVAPGGVLAVQIPYNYEEPIHRIITDVRSRDHWKTVFVNPRELYTLTIGEYFDVLSDISSSFDMWQTVYFHKMPSYENILEWYRGTGLRPYLQQLDDAQKAAFESEILHEIKKAYPLQSNGEIIFKFPRLFFTAVK